MKNLVALMLLLLMAGCKTPDYAAQGYVKATVIRYEVENCGYLLQLENEDKLAPQNGLDAKFKKDGQAVWIKYEISRKKMMSTCMAGKQAVINDIKTRKP